MTWETRVLSEKGVEVVRVEDHSVKGLGAAVGGTLVVSYFSHDHPTFQTTVIDVQGVSIVSIEPISGVYCAVLDARSNYVRWVFSSTLLRGSEEAPQQRRNAFTFGTSILRWARGW